MSGRLTGSFVIASFQINRDWKILLCRKHLVSTMTLSGAPPPPLGHPPYAIMPYYLNTIVEKFLCTDISEASHAPPPPTGAGLARGGLIFSKKKKVSTEQKIFIAKKWC
jgi:hypothetical protein